MLLHSSELEGDTKISYHREIRIFWEIRIEKYGDTYLGAWCASLPSRPGVYPLLNIYEYGTVLNIDMMSGGVPTDASIREKFGCKISVIMRVTFYQT